jgi:hypothetical protein
VTGFDDLDLPEADDQETHDRWMLPLNTLVVASYAV